MIPSTEEILEKNSDPGILKNPTPLVRWPYILYRHGEEWEFSEEQMSFQPFNLLGCFLLVARVFGGLLLLVAITGILVLIAQVLSLFGIVEPMW